MFAIFNLGPMEIMILLGVGVLLFARRLPEVGRYLGKGLVESRGLDDEAVATRMFLALVAALMCLIVWLSWLAGRRKAAAG